MTYRMYIVAGNSKIHKGQAVADLADADTVLIKIKKWEQISLSISSTLVPLENFSEALIGKTCYLTAECYLGLLVQFHINQT